MYRKGLFSKKMIESSWYCFFWFYIFSTRYLSFYPFCTDSLLSKNSLILLPLVFVKVSEKSFFFQTLKFVVFESGVASIFRLLFCFGACFQRKHGTQTINNFFGQFISVMSFFEFNILCWNVLKILTSFFIWF